MILYNYIFPLLEKYSLYLLLFLLYHNLVFKNNNNNNKIYIYMNIFIRIFKKYCYLLSFKILIYNIYLHCIKIFFEIINIKYC